MYRFFVVSIYLDILHLCSLTCAGRFLPFIYPVNFEIKMHSQISKSLAIAAAVLAISASAGMSRYYSLMHRHSRNLPTNYRSVAPSFLDRRQNPCFVVGSTTLPAETADAANAIAADITCGSSTTIGNVPDVSSNGVSFSSINFADSSSTPLQFALDKFATAEPLASTDLNAFTTNLNLYTATEAGIRSEGGNLAIKVPKFFLAYQVARIKTAQGVQITDPGQTVEHLQGKVTKNAAGEDQSLIDQVNALATQLS